MAFRVVLIENGARVRYKLDNLVITINENETLIPLGDVSTIVLDNLDTTISCRVMNTLAKENVCLVICDAEHLPIGMYLGFDTHSRCSKIIHKQIEISDDIKQKFWQKIVTSKIINQSKVLKLLERNQESISKLEQFSKEVEYGDLTNREAHAAKVYFNQLMGKSFSRGDDSILMNSGLNYGYTIVRSFLARLCVGYGLNTTLGFFHRNEYNQFNLVDDLIEPIRPIVDIYVYTLMKDSKIFTSEHRHNLINIVNHKLKYNGKTQYLSNALDEYISSVSSYMKKGDFDKVEMPDVNNYIMGEL